MRKPPHFSIQRASERVNGREIVSVDSRGKHKTVRMKPQSHIVSTAAAVLLVAYAGESTGRDL